MCFIKECVLIKSVRVLLKNVCVLCICFIKECMCVFSATMEVMNMTAVTTNIGATVRHNFRGFHTVHCIFIFAVFL